MPEPLPAVKDYISYMHESNEMRSILTIFEYLNEIDSPLESELLEVLPNNVAADIREYRELTTELSTFSSKSTSELIEEGENLQTEFKHAKIPTEDAMEEIESMLNTKGGHLLVGVSDDGTVSGISNSDWDSADEPSTRLQNLISEYIRPEPVVEGRVEKIDGKRILRIDIPDGDLKPYFHRQEDSDSIEVRIRMGSTNIPASRRQIINLVQNSSWYETTGEKD